MTIEFFGGNNRQCFRFFSSSVILIWLESKSLALIFQLQILLDCENMGRNSSSLKFVMNNIFAMVYWSLALSPFWLFQLVEVEVVNAFSQGQQQFGSRTTKPSWSSLFGSTADSNKVEDFGDWSDERKAGVFQFLLRDLEVEGAPLLGCDGVSANKTLQGISWTIAGQLSENDFERKVCLVLEDIPVKDLAMFVDVFSKLKQQDHLMDSLHDLRRFSLSLVGNGIGPAMILETQNRTETEIQQYASMIKDTPAPNEPQWRAAIESFVHRSYPELEANPIAFRFLGSSDVCDILSGYWNCICELEATDSTDATSVVLSFPPSSSGDEETFTRFAAVSELINTLNSVYESEYKYDVLYFHPSYDSDKIQSKEDDGSAANNGHIPRTSLLRDMMILQAGGDKGASETTLTDDQVLTLQNVQRRSPLPGVIIKRVSKDENAFQKSQFDYQNIMRLAKEGEDKLKEALMEEIKLITES